MELTGLRAIAQGQKYSNPDHCIEHLMNPSAIPERDVGRCNGHQESQLPFIEVIELRISR